MRWGALVAAAGGGTRFGRPKQFVDIAGAPLCAWSIATFTAMPQISAIALVTERDTKERLLDLGRAIAGTKLHAVVAGGETRQASVAAGLAALAGVCDAVAVHDGARPLILAVDIRSAMAEVRPGRAATLAAPVTDTIKEGDEAGRRVVRTIDRTRLWAAQTPQLAMYDELLRAHDDARLRGFDGTDDAQLLEAIGVEVIIVPSSGQNFKVTFEHDLERARSILCGRPPPLLEASR